MRIRTHPAYFMLQNYIVCTITTVFTAFSSFGLAAVSAWFASERWVFARHKGKKWLQDSLDDFWDAVMSIPPFHSLIEGLHTLGLWASSISHRTRAAAAHTSSAIVSVFHRPSVDAFSSSSENSLSSSPAPEAAVSIPQGSRRGSEVTFVPPTTEAKSRQGSITSVTLPSEMSPETSTASPSPPRVRFVQTVRNVIRMQQATSSYSQFSRSLTPTLLTPDGVHRKDTQPMPVQSSRVANLVPKLRGLTLTQDLDAHQALVRHLQFSPNGKFLATSRFVSHSSSGKTNVCKFMTD